MTSFIKPSLYNGRGINNQWMNLIYTSHDLFCGCLHPIDHLKGILKEQQCPTTEKTTLKNSTKEDGEDYHIDDGDLEKLFELTEDAQG